MKHFDIKCFSFGKGLLMVLLVAMQTVLAAQVTLSLQYKEKNNLTTMQTGATATMQLDYSVSSTTGNASGVKIVVTLPDHVYDIPTKVGTAHAPATNFVFDGTAGAKKLTITFIDPVPSGSAGVLEFGMRCNNFTVPNNTVVTTTATLTATGGHTSGPKTNNITLTAIPRICAQKILLNGGALNNNTTYRIAVSTDGSYYPFNASLGTLVPTNMVLKDSLPAGATFVSANVYRLDGNVLVGTGTVSGNVVTANIPNIALRQVGHTGVWEAHPYYVDVTVNYQTPTFSAGTTVTNRAMITYTPHGGSATNLHNGFTVGTCTSDLIEAHTLSNTAISVNMTKSAYPSGNYYPGQEFGYYLGFANNSNVSLNNVEIIDSFPANIRLANNSIRGVRWDDMSKLNRIEYQTNTTGNTWYVAPAATGYADLVPAFPSGQYITKIKFVLVSPFPANTSLSGYHILTFTPLNEPITVQNISNCLKWSSTTAGIPAEPVRTVCDNGITINPRPTTSKTYYYIRQTPSCSGGIIVGQNLTFTGTYTADIGYSNVQNPVCAMLVPKGFQFVSQSFAVGASGLPTAPTLQIIPNYITIGGVVKDLYRWTFPSGTVLPYGKSFEVSATVQVTSALSGGVAYTVDWIGTGGNTTVHQPEYNYGDITDTGDLDLDGNTTETFPRANSDYYGYTCYVTATASMESIKWVKGQVDNQYTRYPETGTTVPGGNADYKLIVKNTGNVPMKEIKIIDILPYISDEGVIDLSARQTQWRPNLAGTITAPPGGTIYYSTTGNPCRDEMKPLAASSPFPTGCVVPNWSTTPPPDITKVQSIKIDFGATILNPSDSLVFTWPMRAPVTAPTNNEIAWNSFGFVATRTDNNQPLLAAEPIKVGIKVQQPSPAIYGNRVWFDTNQNGLQDVGENGVDGIMVRLYRALGASPNPATDPLANFTVTGNGGLYSFPNLPAGNYYAIFHGISQYQLSPANAGSDDAIDSDGTTTVYSGQSAAITGITTLVTGEEDYSWDLGIYCSFTPTLTTNSPVISGNTITLTASGGTTYMWSGPDGFTATGATVTIPNAAASHAGVYTVNVTNAGGCYASMTTNVLVATGPPISLCPGDEYTLSVPSGSVGQWHYNGTPIAGATNITYIVKHTAPGVYHFAGTDAQGCSFTSCTSGVFIAGTSCPTGSVGNYVWTDTNADGINNEPASAGINGVTVQLWSATGDTLIATTTTANDGSGNPGYYNFVVDRNGSYYIKFPTTNGINILTTQTTTAATDNNSDANTSTGKSPNFTITVTGTGVAKDNPTIDAGYRVPPTTVNVTVNNATVCIGGAAMLTATPTGGNGTYTYQWQSSSDNITFANISGATNATYTAPTTTAGVIFYRAVVTSGGLSANSNSTSVTVIADPSVTVASSNGTTICTGGTTTLTATVTGGSGTITYAWESSANGTTWTAVGTNSNTYTTPALTATTYYRVTIAQSVNGCSVVSTNTIINVVADPSITVTASAMNVCIGGVATLTATPSGGTGTPTYQWQSSIDNITFANISGANSSTYSVPTTATSALFYRVNVTYSGAGCGTGTSASTQINVVADPSVTITAGTTICTGGTATLTATVSSGTGTTLYQWQSSSDNVTFTDISGAQSASYTTPALTSNMYYRVNVTQNSGCAVSSSSSMITVTADPSITVTASAMNVCIGGVATLTATPSGGTGTPTYQWQSSIDNITFANISGANSSTYSVPTTATSALFYRVNVTYSGAGCGTGTSASTQINVVADPSVTLTAGSTICTGGTATLTATVSSGTGTTLYQWQSSSDNVTFTDISGATNASYTTPALTSNMYYRVNVTQNSGCAVSSSSSMITVTADPSITVTASAMNVCIGGVATLTATPSGGTGTPTYQWQSSIDNITFANISGANSSTYSVPTTATSALFYRVNVTYSGAGCGTGTSTGTQINVVADPSVTLTAGSTICTGGTATLTATVSGGTGTTLYQWQSSSDNVTFTDISGAQSASYTTPALTSNMYYRVNVTQNSGCAVSSSSSMITVVADPSVTVSGGTTICANNTAMLTANVTNGTGTTTYQWQSSSDNVTFANISGAINATYTTPALTSTTYYRVVINQTGSGCGTATSTGAGVIVNPTIAITTQPTNITQCIGGTQSLSIVATGTGLTYQWQSSSNNSTWTNIVGQTSTSYTPPSTTAGTMYYRVVVSGAPCTAVNSNSATVVTNSLLSLGDYVWLDINNNGLQDVGELGIGNVTVKLYADANNDNIPDGAALATTTTNSAGAYTFNNLCNGRYVVSIVVPTSYVASSTTATSSDPNNATANDNNGISTFNTNELRSNSINLTATNLNVDFGLRGTLNLGNLVWFDNNNNGTRDGGENGVSAVTVQLYQDANNDNTPDGAAIATTTTDGSGIYAFSNLPNGNYMVGITLPTGYVATATTTNSANPNSDTDNDNNGVTVVSGELRSNAITLSAGTEPTTDGDGNNGNLTVDFGVRGALNLGNRVWSDANNNGLLDVGETGIANVQVYLFRDDNGDGVPENSGNPIATTTTDASGNYSFTGLIPGGYMVGIGIPANYIVATVPASGTNPDNNTDNDNNLSRLTGGYNTTGTVFLTAGGEPTTDGDGNNGNLTVDLGLYYPFNACLTSLIIDDFSTNANIINATSRPSPATISGSYINTGSMGGVMTTTLTGRRTIGNTMLGAATGSGYYAVSSAAGDSLGNVMTWDGDNNPALNPTGMACKDLSPYLTLDFVYNDDRPAGSMVNFEVTLYSNTNNASKVNFNYTTGGNGHHGVVSIPLAGLRALSGMSAVDLSCVKAIQLKTDMSGANNNGWDYAIGQIIACAKTLPASVGDYTWNDLNGNGIQESGEPAMSGVTVTLKDNNGTDITSTTTNASGNYLFTNLSPGTYQVVFTTPSGFNTSPALQGGNTATDSDPVGGIATVTLAAGQNNLTIDAGFVLPCVAANITTQPTTFSECIGGTQSLSVVASGTPLTYQWQSSTNNSTWTNIAGATNTTYTPPSTTAGVTYYRVVVTAGACGSVNSNSATVTIVADPSVTVTATAPNVCNGGSVTISANLTGGTGCSYQWQSSPDGTTWTNIPSATNATYITPALNATTRYRVNLNCTGSGCCN